MKPKPTRLAAVIDQLEFIASNDLRYFPIRIGTATVPAHNVVIEHLRYTGHDKAIGGGSIMGFNARLDEKESLLLSCDNITVRNCWIYDSKQAAGCTKLESEVSYFALAPIR